MPSSGSEPGPEIGHAITGVVFLVSCDEFREGITGWLQARKQQTQQSQEQQGHQNTQDRHDQQQGWTRIVLPFGFVALQTTDAALFVVAVGHTSSNHFSAALGAGVGYLIPGWSFTGPSSCSKSGRSGSEPSSWRR